MAAIFEGLGIALLGGLAAALAGTLLEVLRMLLNRKRRRAVFGRTWRENLRNVVTQPQQPPPEERRTGAERRSREHVAAL